MKKTCIIFLILTIILLSYFGISNNNYNKHTEYLRIHIRANSNSDADQNVKYEIKDKIVEYLTPFLSDCDTKTEAEKIISTKLRELELIADDILSKHGFCYTAQAKILTENFPTRVYDNLTLESGFYDALIIYLGEGVGDNWWCVVYPPLCFSGTGNYIYKSKIDEIIKKFFDKEIL